MYKRIVLFCLGIMITAMAMAQDTLLHIEPNRANSEAQQRQPYVVLISIDGFRYDYAEKFQARNLLRLSRGGVRAKGMQPSFPTLTFPNHYTLVTGLYPSHHGIVDNIFYDSARLKEYRVGYRPAVEDSSWYGGTPLWVLAEKQQMVSASYFWVGSEAAVQGVRPTYYFYYNELLSLDRRIQQVTDWLLLPADKRPHLITFYFPEVDHAGHIYGPESEQTRRAVLQVDSAIGKMAAAVDKLKLPVNFIVVSDHGMMQIDTARQLKVLDKVQLDDWKVSIANEKLMLYNNNPQRVQEVYQYFKSHAQHYTPYLKQETPERWHYGQEDRYNRIGDIILLAEPGYMFNERRNRKLPGHHGYDNNLQDMNAVFMAWGPAFKKRRIIDTFANIHVYPLVAKLLGLEITEPVDGKLEVLKSILRR